EHSDAAVIRLNLAAVLDNEHLYGQAESELRRALPILERVHGPRHPRTLTCLNSLGFVQYHQQRYREAEELLLRAVDLKEKVLGPAHPDLAGSLTNLGAVYMAERRYA